MKHLVTIIISVFILSTVNAGQERGNGGDLVRCLDKIVVLDYFEFPYYGPLEEKFKKVNYLKIIDSFLEVVRKNDEARFQELNQIKISFLNNFVLVNNLPDVDDSFHFPIQRNCALVQGAWFLNGKYKVFNRTWSLLNSVNKAGLALHEIIYTYYERQGDENSLRTREYHRFLAKILLAPHMYDYFTYLRIYDL